MSMPPSKCSNVSSWDVCSQPSSRGGTMFSMRQMRQLARGATPDYTIFLLGHTVAILVVFCFLYIYTE